MSTPVDPYESHIPARPRKNPLPWILGGIALFILLVVGGCVTLIVASFKSAEGGKVVAGQFSDSLVQHDYAKAYALMHPDAQKATSQEMLKDLVTLAEKYSAKLTGHSDAVGTFVFTRGGYSGATYTYTFTTQKKDLRGTVTAVRAKEGGWKILNFKLNPSE